jgi:hypothetical protein
MAAANHLNSVLVVLPILTVIVLNTIPIDLDSLQTNILTVIHEGPSGYNCVKAGSPKILSL